MTFSIHNILAELRHQFEALYGKRLVKIVLYGSHARGDAEPESDIDILVVLKELVNPCKEIARTEEITATLSLKHDVVISCAFVAADRFSTEQSPFLLNVRREGIVV